MPLISKNPATEEVIKKYEELRPQDLEKKISQAQRVFESWRLTGFDERKKLALRLGEILKGDAEKIAALMTREMGKPITQSISEVKKCAWLCEYYAENFEEFLAEERVKTESRETYVRFDPIGIVLAVMPWNFPLWQVLRFAVPATMAGNVGLLKHASNVPGSAEKIEEIFLKAGFPKGVFQNILIGSSRVKSVIRDPRIKAVTLTGSEHAGSQVAKTAGEEIKKTVLELGGSDPFIVLEDADIPAACNAAADSRLINNGQSCIAAKRFIVLKSAAEKFLNIYVPRFENIKVGNPMDETVEVGPLATESILKEIKSQVEKSVAMGAKILAGGKQPAGKGYFYKPTILGNVSKGMPAYDEEVFGPVAAVIVVNNEEEAVRAANDTQFGLGASIWTKNTDRAKKIIPLINAGSVFVNEMVASDPRLPFGGVGKSGYGRELSHYGLKEFVNIKTVKIS